MRFASVPFVVLALPLLACSAIVTPDPSRLGGVDAGPGSSPDAFSPMGCAGGCDDGVPCTTDSCVASTCQHTPDDTVCGAMQRCAATGCVPRTCGGPGDCDDGNACTVDQCVSGACMPIARDADMDGRGDAACGGDDCDDGNPNVSPARPEQCGNGVDDDCNAGTSDTCMMGVPDTCETSQLVDLSSGTATVRGNFAALTASYPTYCLDEARRAGRDAVYRIELGARVSDVRIETIGDLDTVISIAGECGDGFALPTCNDDARDGERNARVFLHPTAGTIFVLVSAFDADGGEYEVRFTASPVAPNECGEGSLDVTEGGTVIGVPIPPSRVTGTCMPDGTSRALEATMHADVGDVDLTLFAGFSAYLHARTSCDLRDEELCEASTPLGMDASFLEANLRTDARRLHLFVDGATASDQVYALFVRP